MSIQFELVSYWYIQCTCPSVNFFPLQPGGTPQEFIVVREGDDNFSFSVNLGSDGIAYMVPSTSNKDVVMNTQVAITDSFIMNIEEVPPE